MLGSRVWSFTFWYGIRILAVDRFEMRGIAWSDLSVMRIVSRVNLPIKMPYSCRNSMP